MRRNAHRNRPWTLRSAGRLPSVDVEGHLDRMPTAEELASHDRRTEQHIENVARKMGLLAGQVTYCIYQHDGDLPVAEEAARWIQRLLEDRAQNHDNSKREWPERPIFARTDARLKNLTYGSEEYEEALGFLGPALEHHYAANPHHPEFYDDGIRGMNLLDLGEMACDWAAAIERHEDGHPLQSMNKNRTRFDIPDGMALMLTNTLFWLSGQPMPPEAKRESTILGLFWAFIMNQRADRRRKPGRHENQREARHMPVWTVDDAVQEVLANTRKSLSMSDHNLFPNDNLQ